MLKADIPMVDVRACLLVPRIVKHDSVHHVPLPFIHPVIGSRGCNGAKIHLINVKIDFVDSAGLITG
jgi:hypothetical protein